MEEFLVSFIAEMAIKFPWVVAILSAMGFLRLIFKPTLAYARTIVMATKTKSDDLVLDKIEESKITKAIVFLLDLFASIKVK